MSGVHIFCKSIPISIDTCTFLRFVTGDYCVTVPYILINFVQVNRLKNSLRVDGNPDKETRNSGAMNLT